MPINQYIILIFSFLLTTALYGQQEEVPTYFILQTYSGFKSDLHELYKPSEYNLVLLEKGNKIKDLTAKQEGVFYEIHTLKEFNFDVLKKTVESIIKSKNNLFDFITNDEASIALAAKLRDYFHPGKSSFSRINIFLNKDLMKKELKKNDPSVTLPKYVLFNPQEYQKHPQEYVQEVIKYLSFPIFIKPVDSSGAYLTKKVLNDVELKKWLEENKEKENFELDEYIEGDLYHCDSLVLDGKILFSEVGKYNYPCSEFLHDKPNGSIILPSLNTDAILIKKFNERIIKALNPPNGATHLELFKKLDGKLIFLEVAARTPGAYTPPAYSKALGINVEEAHFKLQMGVDCGETCKIKKNSHAAWVWFPKKDGIIKEIYRPSIHSNFEITTTVQIGENLTQAEELKDWAIGVVLWDNEYARVVEDFNKLSFQYIPFSLTSPVVNLSNNFINSK